MANKKKQKYPSKSQIRAEARRYVIKNGEYNGGEDSDAFMVTGHSTGSPYSEMEEISEQLTRDVKGYKYQEPEYASDAGETGYEYNLREGLGDLGGPELYGDKPSLLKKSPVAHAATSRKLAIGAAVGLAATAVLGGLAYAFYRSSLTPPARRGTSGHAPRALTGAAASASTAKASRSTPAKSARSSKAKSASSTKASAQKSSTSRSRKSMTADLDGAAPIAKSRTRRSVKSRAQEAH